ncbi:MAG TPA: aminotransferase class I/II-fold pyridoxal phosphate-dependent enzyme, partial [Actinotalea sp.]
MDEHRAIAFDLPTPDQMRSRGGLKWSVQADIAAWVAESDFGTAPAVTAAVLDAVQRGLTGYLPAGLRHDLADACARWHLDRYGWAVDADLVQPVGDVLDALRITLAHYSRPGSAVIVPTPAYMPFVTAPQAWGRQVVEVPMVDGTDGRPTLDLDAIEAAFAAGGHLVVLTNPHNPTGRVHTRAELLALAEVVERHGGRVFADEIHAPLVYAGTRHIPYASLTASTAAHTVTATSASKAFNVPGLKCAQILLSNEADAAVWRPIAQYLSAGASTLGAVANIAAYRSGGPWLDGVITYLDGNRRALRDTLAACAPRVRYVLPEGTYLAWLDLREAMSVRKQDAGLRTEGGGRELEQPAPDGLDDLAGWLLAGTGVALVDGSACGRAGRGFVRLNLAMPRPL